MNIVSRLKKWNYGQVAGRESSAFLQKVKTKKAEVAVIGLGYVGLPLAVRACQVGYKTIGIDINSSRVRQVNAGRSYIGDLESQALAPWVKKGRLKAFSDWKTVSRADILIICTPTPFNKNKEPDLSYVTAAAREISKRLKSQALVVLESSTYPGTTEEILLPLLARADRTVGRHFFLAYSPERVDPGNSTYKVQDIPKVVGGVTPACLEAACVFYQALVPKVIPVSNPKIAEMSKLLENIFRNVNIALVNELAMLCDRMKLDVWEVIEAASTKPFGFMSFMPGPGVGGHCIPVDPVYLSWKAKEYDFYTHFIDLAAEVNSNMPYFVVKKLLRLLMRYKRVSRPWKIFVLGVTFKKNVADARNSSATKLIELMRLEGLQTAFHDPYIEELELEDGTRIKASPLSERLLAAQDCVVIHTDHSSYDWNWVARHSPLILDTRNVLKNAGELREKIFRL